MELIEKRDSNPPSRTTLWAWCCDGRFPSAIDSRKRQLLWKLTDIEEWLTLRS
jgi:predicted DNA-binding transcriptional regulator AlpA